MGFWDQKPQKPNPKNPKTQKWVFGFLPTLPSTNLIRVENRISVPFLRPDGQPSDRENIYFLNSLPKTSNGLELHSSTRRLLENCVMKLGYQSYHEIFVPLFSIEKNDWKIFSAENFHADSTYKMFTDMHVHMKIYWLPYVQECNTYVDPTHGRT